MKGLKQMVAEATEQIQKQAEPEPVLVSGDAIFSLTKHLRQWSGWSNATMQTGDPRKMGLPSPIAACNHSTHQFVFNTDTLVRNPNKVLLTVTPFRLRQEAILTGSMLHEAGHARHSKWQPGRYGNGDVIHHSDQTPATAQTVALARLMEEPRIEGLMARDERSMGAAGLGWTMRASAAELQKMTRLAADPNQKVMDLITSWALRAGRQYALDAWLPNYTPRGWVQEFTTLLTSAIMDHLTARCDAGALDCNPVTDARKIINALLQMTSCADDTGPEMIDLARAALDLLFPETPGETEDDKPMPGEGCASDQSDDSESESSEAEQGEQGDETEGEGDEAEGEGEPEVGEDEPEQGDGDNPSEEEQDEQEGDASSSTDEPDSEEDDEPDSEEDDEPDSEEEGEPEQGDEAGGQGEQADTTSDLAKALADMEDRADDETEDQSEGEADDAEDAAANGAGTGAGNSDGNGWRQPTKDEREIQAGAERFIRTLIDASESTLLSLTDTPSSSVDGAAMAAWKAGGQRRDPRFFIRTQRNSEPSPPVKVAVLVDVSFSMSQLQKPSAILSWALSAAALDLQNFAGRGQQVETTMIHWGSHAEVVQKNGEMLPGIKEHACNQGTRVMHEAMALVEEQMPGFFDITERPVNRLLVQFTDWELYGDLDKTIIPWMDRAMESGVNMLSVVPTSYNVRKSKIKQVMAGCKTQRGRTDLLRYNPNSPAQVWEQAAETLR